MFAAVALTALALVSPSAVASNVAGKPVAVTVSTGSGYMGDAFVGGNEIRLSRLAYRDVQRGGGVGLFVLLHETGHLTGIGGGDGELGALSNEHRADCFALAHLKPALKRFWPHLNTQQIRWRYQDALAWTKYAGNRCS